MLALDWLMALPLAVGGADRGGDDADRQHDGRDQTLDDTPHVQTLVRGKSGRHDQAAGLRQTMSRITIGFGIRPSLWKRSATPCWVVTMSSVTGPTTKDERLAAMVWISSGMPVTAASDLATSSRCCSAHLAVAVVTSTICCRIAPWFFAKSRLAM